VGKESAEKAWTKCVHMDVSELKALAAAGLVQMFDTKRRLFCFRLKRDRDTFVREGFSPRYTIMTLLGLHRLETSGLGSPVEIRPIFRSLLESYDWINNIGDVGLILWLCAVTSPENLQAICSSLRVESALDRFRGARHGRTMELAWFLSGLSHASMEMPARKRLDLKNLAVNAYEALKKNQGDHGIFGHQATGRSLPGILRGHIGSFADQVYPIYALTQFAKAYNIQAALRIARNCADAICRAQGPLGQWWWHYDALKGVVSQRYPVYAVHQDGMAPMALFALSEATGVDYDEPIYRGLAWINGNNELGADLRDRSSGVIWRSIYRPTSWKKYRDEVCELLRPERAAESVGDLKILFECRPYHLGWLLYAFAGRDCD